MPFTLNLNTLKFHSKCSPLIIFASRNTIRSRRPVAASKQDGGRRRETLCGGDETDSRARSQEHQQELSAEERSAKRLDKNRHTAGGTPQKGHG